MDWLSNLFGGISNAAGGAGKSLMGGMGNIGNMMSMFGGNKGGGSNSGMGQSPMTNLGTGAIQGAQQGGGNLMNSIFKNPAAGIGGLGVIGIGQMMNKPVKMPDFNSNPYVQQLGQWNQTANHPMDPNVQQAMQNTLNIQNEQQLRNLRDVYKNARPGTDYTTDSAYQRDAANLNRQISSQNADAMAGAQFQSNNQQLGNLNNLASLGVGSQMGQAAMDAQRQQQQNQMFGNIGSMLLQSGIGMPDFMKLFGGGK